ncbi:GntR family transcriptional regulator [Tamilnaduibacter salinus]|uniref:GntR family transcriptional regulator n=1 Tax=Tamilnaduibacter salinus TaxID=1484056 RepID=A0A2A2I2E0_9GAMM|nr:GntR family transcriptional regulator [Tamilnaduibacter salinus]PAV25807.1 GntR family transcriptional regulator [Tamilnaduibacter salinus]PVY75789.1 GntR family transcriptional regulator [Tamilnaduibacter salinus]
MEFQAPNTLAEQIANYLADRIMTGDIAPGARVHEATIASDLDVSRASVKEALYTLERWHLVDITPRKGATATVMDAHHASELYDVYMHLLIMLARRLCERWEEQDRELLLARIRSVTDTLRNTTPDISAVVQASFGVMDISCDVVNNPYLTEALSNFKPAVSRTFYFSADRYRQDLDRTSAFFTQLTQAVLRRDKDEAERQIVQFAEHQKTLIIHALDNK